MKQKFPDQSPEAIRKNLEALGISVDPDRVFAFMNAAMNQQPVDTEDARSAAAFLFELLQAAKYDRDWNAYKKRLGVKADKRMAAVMKGNKGAFDSRLVTMDSPVFGVVYRHLKSQDGGRGAAKVVVLEVMELADVGETRAKEIIKDLTPKVKQAIEFEAQIKRLSQ